MKALFFIFTTFILAANNLSASAIPSKSALDTIPSITGIWADSTSASFTNCHIIFSEQNGKVTFVHYLELNGNSMVEEGKGFIKGNQVEYDVIVTRVIPGWATSGKHLLTLSDDGKKLTGIYKDAKGNTGPMTFVKLN